MLDLTEEMKKFFKHLSLDETDFIRILGRDSSVADHIYSNILIITSSIFDLDDLVEKLAYLIEKENIAEVLRAMKIKVAHRDKNAYIIRVRKSGSD